LCNFARANTTSTDGAVGPASPSGAVPAPLFPGAVPAELQKTPYCAPQRMDAKILAAAQAGLRVWGGIARGTRAGIPGAGFALAQKFEGVMT
jgi:hypothetical protein